MLLQIKHFVNKHFRDISYSWVNCLSDLFPLSRTNCSHLKISQKKNVCVEFVRRRTPAVQLLPVVRKFTVQYNAATTMFIAKYNAPTGTIVVVLQRVYSTFSNAKHDLSHSIMRRNGRKLEMMRGLSVQEPNELKT
jgi:hypothetical protein